MIAVKRSTLFKDIRSVFSQTSLPANSKKQSIIMINLKKLLGLDFSGILFTVLERNRRECNILFFNYFIHFLCYLRGVKLGKNVIFNGRPIIHRYFNSNIYLGNGSLFNSSKNSVIIGLNQPCSFVTLGKDAEIVFGNNSGATGIKIAARAKIKIGNNVLIGSNCTIVDNDFHHSDPRKRTSDYIPTKPIIIEDNVFIGFHCFILKGSTIGKNSIIGANSVVCNDIPENSIAMGNPCRVIMKNIYT